MLKRAVIAQGGGPTRVINRTLLGIVERLRMYHFDAIYGARHGIQGLINQNLVDLTDPQTSNVELVSTMPGSTLWTTRDKADDEGCEKIFKVLQAHGITHFFYIGGNDTGETLEKIARYAAPINYDLICIHVAKTVDNDLEKNHFSPGFPSAARYVVEHFTGVGLDNESFGGIYAGIVMGRDAGWLTGAAGLGKADLVYLPERPFEIKAFLDDINNVYTTHGHCVVAVSESIRDSSGEVIASKLQDLKKDAYGHLQLTGSLLPNYLEGEITKVLNPSRVRCEALGYAVRSHAGCVSDVDWREAYKLGQQAVTLGLEESGSVTIRSSGPDSFFNRLVPHSEVAGLTRRMPDEFITQHGNGVTKAFEDYLRPLLGSSVSRARRLRAPVVPKINLDL